jgi:L-rhamnose mutarotase
MARAAFVLTIRPDKVEQYLAAHREVWPEMRDALREAGFRNYSIHLSGRQAFGYFEADDPAAALAAMAETDVNTRWQDRMAELLEQRVDDDGPGLLPEIFRLD